MSLRHIGLAVVLVGLLTAPVWVLGYNVNQSVAPDLEEPTADLGAPYAGTYAAPQSVFEDKTDSAGLVCVSLVVRTVDPLRLTASSSILVTPTQEAQDALAARVARGESATQAQVMLRIEYRLGAKDATIRMPLANLLAAEPAVYRWSARPTSSPRVRRIRRTSSCPSSGSRARFPTTGTG